MKVPRLPEPFKAHDVRKLRVCAHCGSIGYGPFMLEVSGKPWHDYCVVEQFSDTQILALPREQREKITLGSAGVSLMRKLMDAPR